MCLAAWWHTQPTAKRRPSPDLSSPRKGPWFSPWAFVGQTLAQHQYIPVTKSRRSCFSQGSACGYTLKSGQIVSLAAPVQHARSEQTASMRPQLPSLAASLYAPLRTYQAGGLMDLSIDRATDKSTRRSRRKLQLLVCRALPLLAIFLLQLSSPRMPKKPWTGRARIQAAPPSLVSERFNTSPAIATLGMTTSPQRFRSAGAAAKMAQNKNRFFTKAYSTSRLPRSGDMAATYALPCRLARAAQTNAPRI